MITHWDELQARRQERGHIAGEYADVQSGPDLDYGELDIPGGTTVEAGRYLLVDESTDPRLASDVVLKRPSMLLQKPQL